MSNKHAGLTRRQVLKGAGAAAALGAIPFSSSRAAIEGNWDQQADIVIVGTGVGASTAALMAQENGDSVIMLEKATSFGGTSVKSAGVLWIPNNFTLRGKGIDDRKEDCLKYMARFSYAERYNASLSYLGLEKDEFELLEAFYDNASKAIDTLRDKDALKLAEWRMYHLDRPATDYLDHVPENKVPAGRALGPLLSDGSIGLGAHLMEQLKAALDRLDTEVLFSHRAVRLVLNDSGRVVGMEAEHENQVVSLRARKAVIFATGGYVHNTKAVARHQRSFIYGSCATPNATGDFINIAGAAGARMGNMSGAWRTQILLEEALSDRVLSAGVFFPPGDSMFQVNKYGLRAVNENRNYNDRTEIHSTYDSSRAEYPNQFMFMIYDQRTAEAFAGAYPLPTKPESTKYVLHGESLTELSSKIEKRLKEISSETGGFSLDTSFNENLKKSISRFNDFARTGKDKDFQRGDADYDTEWYQVFSPMKKDSQWPRNEGPNITMHPFREQGPYYAIILAAGALDTTGGPLIDANAQVRSTNGQPIPGLYGAGNCIASPSREAYWGAGHTLALSLTFGFIAANAAHREPRDEA